MTVITSDVQDRTVAMQDHTESLISLGNVRLDLDTYEATVDGKYVDLTYLEFELLRLFVQNPGRIFSYQFWTLGLLAKYDHGAQRHLAVLVHRLRQKLAASEPYVIKTVRGRGYGFLLAGGQLEHD